MPSTVNATKPYPTYFVGHAGVGLLFNDSINNKTVQANLKEIGQEILSLSPRPKALVVFSGHFEAGEIHGTGVIEVNVKRETYIQHDFVNDFHDTHPFVYNYTWSHTDDPTQATQIWQKLRNAGIKAKRVDHGVDHGVWVPFKIMIPEETPLDIPVIRVSTFHGYDLGSGGRFGWGRFWGSYDEEREATRAKVLAESKAFDKHLRAAVTKKSAKERSEALLKLEDLYEFKRSHPTVEHFTPLWVAAGAAGDAEVEPLGVDIVEPGMSYLNLRFA
ncbi:Extradiol ring-cleavage dioxygenase, class III enzyme, subunit B [Aspergillus crustosus]